MVAVEFKEYQQRVLDTFDAYLDELIVRRDKLLVARQALEAAGQDTSIVPDNISEKSWEALNDKGALPAYRAHIAYSPRHDGTGRRVPNVCLKVPTGGGKTLLACAATARLVNRFQKRNTGFVLWVVPNEAIYTQTKKALKDREHPYRQMLDKAGAGRVKILEKDDPLHARDVDGHLCVMLLMLQAANRQTKETLRLFRDRGNVHGFFPQLDDYERHAAVLKQVPNLDVYGESDQMGAIIKDSLGNVLRMIQPIIIIDEGHKALSNLAVETTYGFNPSFVLELSATPKDRPKATPPMYTNQLVDVRGRDLEREEMIKMPINLKVKGGDDWQAVLRESLEHTNKLQGEADRLRANSARYIRPILLVQVERTGKEQRETGFIHAEDAREYLLTLGLAENEIAVKTAEVNELTAPENLDLLAETCPVRVIITKQALQEGWDCPFAYALCALSANSNMGAMTQLVGRILRQPHALKTHLSLLDECYVFCHHASTAEVVTGIKRSLEQDGMSDLVQMIREETDSGNEGATVRRINRKPEFAQRIFFPTVLWADTASPRNLDYDTDILSRVDWDTLDIQRLADGIVPTHGATSAVVRIGLDILDDDRRESMQSEASQETAKFDPVFATRAISDIVPNPWVARSIVGGTVKLLLAGGWDEDTLGSQSSEVIDGLRKGLIEQRDEIAEALFMGDVRQERIQFRLRTDGRNWELPGHYITDKPGNAQLLYRPSDARPVEKNLFTHTFKDDYNNLEAEFACYLDEEKALNWWHRNVARGANYGLQGWRRHKVYPDFLFALAKAEGKQQLVAYETKGEQLAGNHDTAYKKKLLDTLTDNYRFENVRKAGELEIQFDADTTVVCDLVVGEDWKAGLKGLLEA